MGNTSASLTHLAHEIELGRARPKLRSPARLYRRRTAGQYPIREDKTMNVIWIVADTFRRDHLGAYGVDFIHTPALDSLASRSVRFDRHYSGAFPTMPARADHFTGRWTMSFMGWEPFSDGVGTLAQLLADQGVHTAAVVDTPFDPRRIDPNSVRLRRRALSFASSSRGLLGFVMK